MTIKQRLKTVVPPFVLRIYHRVLRMLLDFRNAKKTPKEVFSEIYRRGDWGGPPGVFCSGIGSSADFIVKPYVANLIAYLRTYGPKKPRVVDLGCGDYRVGGHFAEYCSEYVGIDIVPDLIRHLQSSITQDHVKFLCLDMIEDELPAGDVCLVRQVFQHLSNEQISKVLVKLRQYKVIFITEHYPSERASIIPNLNKVHGGGIRLSENSGVYLDKAPFNIPAATLELFLEVPANDLDADPDPGVIRTHIWRPSGIAGDPALSAQNSQ